MKYFFAFALCLIGGAGYGQPYGPGPLPPNTRPLFVNTTASASIAFVQNVDSALTPCTFSIPAGTLQKAGDVINWWAGGTMVSSTDLKTVTIRYGGAGVGGTNISAGTGATASSLIWQAQGKITRITTSTQRVTSGGVVGNSGNTAFTSANPAASINDAIAQLFVVTAKSANATPPNDSITCTDMHLTFEAGP